MIPWRWLIGLFLGVLVLCLAFGIGWFSSNCDGQSMVGRTLALDWGDRLDDNGNVTSKGLYGAHVFVTAEGDGYGVTGRIYIGRPDAFVGYFHDCGVIGHANSLAEAHEKWGKITWTPNAVIFGDPKAGHHELRKDFQRHR